MSELQKIQADWRSNFKDLLLIERKLPKYKTPERETQRFSLDLSEEFRTLLEEKKIAKINNYCENISREVKEMEGKENNIQSVNMFKSSKKCYQNDSTIMYQGSPFGQRNLDDSFEAIEKMCNKSASDPNSTLFKYLKKNDPKVEIREPTSDEEADALQRLLDQLSKEEKQEEEEEEGNVKSQDETQLHEIEAPSRFWDNSILGESIHQVTPVKSSKLPRPSTIMEDGSESEGNSSSSSFKSTQKCSDFYETASSMATNSHCFNKSNEKSLAESFNLIELNESCISCSSSSQEDSVIEILSDNEEEKVNKEILIDGRKMKSEFKSESFRSETNGASSICLINIENQEEISEEEDSTDKSLHFNDTMEEVDYMMKKGMEYLEAAKNVTVADVPFVRKEIDQIKSPFCMEKSLDNLENTIKNSQSAHNHRFKSPTFKMSSPATASPKGNTKSKIVKRLLPDMKPTSKLEIFKKPLRNDSQHNTLSASKKHAFSHIISPVGAYIKKTATTPLISEIKCSKTDVMNSNTFRKLEYEARSIHPFKKDTKFNSSKSPGSNSCSLPKKAYISSEFKHVVDERTPFKIPGGEKIQKYLQPSLLPAVVRHDGKIKSPAIGMKSKNTKPPSPRDSLADLSLMSGDVSLYTIRDAQRF